MSNTLKQLIESLVAEELRGISLSESWRGFSMKRFKKLHTFEQRLEYAREHLPRLGRGSAREVFGLGSGKVLKIAYGRYGKFQTRNEVEVYTSGRAKEFLARIYDFDSENYMWLISEGVKIFIDNSDLMAKIHPSEMVLEKIHTHAHNGDSFEESLQLAISYQNQNYDQGFGPYEVDYPLEIQELTELDLELFHKVYEATLVGLEDIDRYDHWGVTTNGKVVVADYGLTNEGSRNE